MSNQFVEITVTSWESFKSEVSTRSMAAQWYEKQMGVPNNNIYCLYAKDGFLLFSYFLENDGSSDVVDFETNYKDIWNVRQDYRDNGGITQVIASPRPPGMTTYYSSSGDGAGVGDGTEILFDMLSTDAEKTIDLTYNETIYIKDGTLLPVDAPMGAKLDVLIVHPVAGVVGSFCRNVSVNGSVPVQLNSEDKGELLQGLILRFVLHNATGLNGHDAAADFKLSGIVEMYRVNTV